MQTNGKNKVVGLVVASAIEFLRSELGAKIGWVVLSVIGILAGYLSIRSTFSVLAVWSADRGLSGGMNIPVSIGLNLAILAMSFGAWHEVRRHDSPVGTMQLARMVLRKALWVALLIFQFVWLFAPLSLVLTIVLTLPAALAFTALPLILEKTESKLFGDHVGKRVNRFVIRIAGLTSLVLLPVILTFSAINANIDSRLTATGFFSGTAAILASGALTIFLAVFVFYGWELIISNGKNLWRAVRAANLANALVSLVVLVAAITLVGVYGYTTLGGLGGAIRDNGTVTIGFAVMTWQIWIVLAFMATLGPLALGYIEGWLQGFTAQSAPKIYSNMADDLPDMRQGEFEEDEDEDNGGEFNQNEDDDEDLPGVSDKS